MKRLSRLILATCLILALPGLARAQAPPGPLPPKPGAPVQQPPAAAQIKVKVDLVSTPVTVRDPSGEPVLSLEKENFRIFDNGIEQRIEDFDLGGDPLSVALVVEASSRIEPMLPAIRKTGLLVTENVLGQSGEAALLAFDDELNLVLPFTSDHDAIQKALAGLRMGTSGARLYDAMQRGVSLLQERPPNRRRVLLVISEAVDTGSEVKLGEVLREAQLANVVIYTVGISTTAALLRGQNHHRGPAPLGPEGTFPLPPRAGTPQTPTTEQQRRGNIDLMALILWLVSQAGNAVGENALEAATIGTGGLHIPTFRDASIERALSEIGAELHTQYVLTYRPTGTSATGYHEIKVEVKPGNLKVRARPGYYLAP